MHASVVEENEKIILEKTKQDFDFIMNKLDDRALQCVFRNISKIDLAKALYASNTTIDERAIPNLSKRAARMLREDMSSFNFLDLIDQEASQNKIVEVYRKLIKDGYIVVGRR
jgi:flagellar motor switch protein FliG